jgi:hypothetical protein
MRREELYLTDIVEAADAIQQFLAGVQRDTFLQDELLPRQPGCESLAAKSQGFAHHHGFIRERSSLPPAIRTTSHPST